MSRSIVLLGCLLLLSSCVSIQDEKKLTVQKELAPSGKLRLAAVLAPIGSAVLVGKDEKTGQYAGVPVEIAAELARQIEVPLEVIPFKTGNEIRASAAKDVWDVVFTPQNPETEKFFALGPVYLIVESGYLVPPNSRIRTLADVDQPGVRVVARANSPQGRHLRSSLKNAMLIGVATADEQLALVRSGKADVLTAGKTYLLLQAKEWPGSRVLDGGYSREHVVIGLPHGRPKAMEYLNEFVENAKVSGVIRRAYDKLGFHDLPVPPPVVRK